MKLVLSAAGAMAALALMGCGGDPNSTPKQATTDGYPMPPTSSPAPDVNPPAANGTVGNPNPGQPLNPTDPNAPPPGSPPPVLPTTPPS